MMERELNYPKGEPKLDEFPGCGHLPIHELPFTQLGDNPEYKYRYCPECGIVVFRPEDQDIAVIEVKEFYDEYNIQPTLQAIIYNFSDNRPYVEAVSYMAYFLWAERLYGAHEGHGYLFEINENSIGVELRMKNRKISFTLEFAFRKNKAYLHIKKHPSFNVILFERWLN